MKIRIEPFKKFWLDCSSTILLSIISSNKSIDDIVLYNNDYIYKVVSASINDKKKMQYVSMVQEMSMIKNNIMEVVERRNFNIVEERSIIDEIINTLKEDKGLVVCIDMYYWINDSLFYHKEHIKHYALIVGYDEQSKCIITYDCGGTEGYHEYKMPYKDVEMSLKEAEESVYAVVDYKSIDYKKFIFSYSQIINNAQKIINSIDGIFSNSENLYIIDCENDYEAKYFGKCINVSIYSFEERSKANMLLFSEQKEIYIRYYELLKKYKRLRANIIRMYMSKDRNKFTQKLKKEILELLNEEKEILLHFLNAN